MIYYLNVFLEVIALLLLIPMTRMVYRLGGKNQTFLIFFPVVMWISLTAFSVGTVSRLTGHRGVTIGTYATTFAVTAFIVIEVWVMVKIYRARNQAARETKKAAAQKRSETNFVLTLARQPVYIPRQRPVSEGLLAVNGSVTRKV